jgi:hypothetical protein
MFRMTIVNTFDPGRARSAYMAAQIERLRKGVNYAYTLAYRNCPVDTGDLQLSLTMIPDPDGMSWRIVATMYYASYVEFGHMSRGGWVAPNPFLRRAIREAQAAYPDLMWGSVVIGVGGSVGAGVIGRP